MPTNDAPFLRQNVKWGEEYVSRGLNAKLAGIIPTGVFHGFVLKPGGHMAILVDHDENYPRSIAVVERDGFSLTIVMDDPGIVEIPAPGTWYVCIEAFYSASQQGYQRIVVREQPDDHHVILGAVSVESSDYIDSTMISYEQRNNSSDITNVSLDLAYSVINDLRHTKQAIWKTEKKILNGETLILPEGITYIPGMNLVALSWDGVVCYPDSQFLECPAPEGGTESSSLTLLFDAPAESEFHVLIRPYSQQELGTSKETSSLIQRMVNLENTLAQVAEGAMYVTPPGN